MKREKNESGISSGKEANMEISRSTEGKKKTIVGEEILLCTATDRWLSDGSQTVITRSSMLSSLAALICSRPRYPSGTRILIESCG